MTRSTNAPSTDTLPARDATSASEHGMASLARLPDATRIRRVTLLVSDLARSRTWYTQVLGFRVLTESASQLTLGAHDSDAPLIELIERRGARAPGARKRLGLYHVAILLPTRGALGRFVRHLHQTGVRFGASDHLVSEALYLQDPDDLGIEVYADRPRAMWARHGEELSMATTSLDARGLIDAGGAEAWAGMPSGTSIGHVHLHVGDIATASRFYADGVGFDRTVWSYPGALFLAAGGYHHHLGTNIWAGTNAIAPHADEPQLLEWIVEVPTRADVDAIALRMTGAGFTTQPSPDGTSFVTRDPWGTPLRIAAA